MASAMIHMVVANEINKKIKCDRNQILLGSIAPDISKLVGETKLKSHFLNSIDNDIPNIDAFLLKYKHKLDDDFVMGYFIHLYTDYLWFKYFVPEFYNKNMITKLDGTVVKSNGEMINLYIYNDYTNLNKQLLDEYDIDLKIFYNELPKINNIIEEIPIQNIDILVNELGLIIEKAGKNTNFVFDITNIKKFVETCCNLIIAKLNEFNI